MPTEAPSELNDYIGKDNGDRESQSSIILKLAPTLTTKENLDGYRERSKSPNRQILSLNLVQ